MIDARRAIYDTGQHIELKLTRTEENNATHLPILDVRGCFPDISDVDWNNLMNLLAISAERQPFGKPYYWQSHVRISFARWLRSWRA